MKLIRPVLVALAALLIASGAMAQTRPVTNPTYIPTGQLAPITTAAVAVPTSTSSFIIQGEGTVSVQLSGTFTGLAATIQVTASPLSISDASAVWTNYFTVVNSGLYRVKSAGLTRVRLNLTALATGSVVTTMTGSPGPYDGQNIDLGAIITATNQVASTTLTSAQFTTPDGNGLVCTMSITAESGDPEATFLVQSYDAASNTYLTMLSSAGVNNIASGTTVSQGTLEIYPGIQTTGLPTGMASINLKLPRAWRVQLIASAGVGTLPGLTATVGCNVLQ